MKIRLFPDAVLYVLCLWLPVEFFIFGKFSVFFVSDNTELNLPRLMVMKFGDAAHSLWDPYPSAGADRKTFAFMGQLDIFLFDIFPAWFAHSLRVSSQIVVGFLATYALGRRTFGFGPGASMFAAGAFALTIDSLLMGSTVGYMPAVLLALSYLLDDKTDVKRWSFAALAIYVVAETAFFSRLVPYASALIVAWFLFADTRRGFGDWLIILGGSVLVFVLRLDDFIAIKALYPHSQLPLTRYVADFDAALANALDIGQTFRDPWFTTCILLFAYALVMRKFGDFRMKGILVWILLMQAFKPFVIGMEVLLSPTVPFLRGAELERAANIVNMAVVFAGGYGMQALLDQTRDMGGARSLGLWTRGAAVVLAVGVLGYMSVKTKYAGLLNWMTHGSYVQRFESPVLEELAATIRSKPMPERVEPFQLPPTHLNAYGLETAGAYHTVYGRRYYEFWATLVEPWAARLEPANPSARFYAERRRQTRDWPVFRDDRLWLFPDEYRPAVRVGGDFNLNLLSLLNVAYLVSRDRLVDETLIPVREMKSSWSSLDRRDRARLNLRANFRGREHLYVYRNRDAFPRFFSVPRVRVFDSERRVLDALSRASTADLRTAAYVDNDALPAGLTENRAFGPLDIRMQSYGGDEIRLAVSADAPGLLIVANGYSPFWVCEIDGVKTPVFPAYHALWGVVVPVGAKSVVFRYAPPYWHAALLAR